MVDAHQNLNGSRHLTTPLSGMVCRRWAIALATINLSAKFEVSNSTHYEDVRGDTICRKLGGWFRIVQVSGHSRSLEIAPIDRAHTSSY